VLLLSPSAAAAAAAAASVLESANPRASRSKSFDANLRVLKVQGIERSTKDDLD
jgi:hypothetical protein